MAAGGSACIAVSVLTRGVSERDGGAWRGESAASTFFSRFPRLQALRHPHLAPCIDLYDIKGRAFLLAYHTHSTLAALLHGAPAVVEAWCHAFHVDSHADTSGSTRIDSCGPGSAATGYAQRRLNDAFASQLCQHVSRGVQYLHAHGLVHGRISPECILLVRATKSGVAAESSPDVDKAHVLLSDYGYGVLTEGDISLDRTQPLEFCAPEVISALLLRKGARGSESLGARSIEPAADLWAVGAVLLYSLSNACPRLPWSPRPSPSGPEGATCISRTRDICEGILAFAGVYTRQMHTHTVPARPDSVPEFCRRFLPNYASWQQGKKDDTALRPGVAGEEAGLAAVVWQLLDPESWRRPSAHSLLVCPILELDGRGQEAEGQGSRRCGWVEGPAVAGLHGLIPTQVAELLMQGRDGQDAVAVTAEQSRAGNGTGIHQSSPVKGQLGGWWQRTQVVGVQVQEEVREEASVLRELVYYFLRGGGDLGAELMHNEGSSWPVARLHTCQLSSCRASCPSPSLAIEQHPQTPMVISPARLRRFLQTAVPLETRLNGDMQFAKMNNEAPCWYGSCGAGAMASCPLRPVSPPGAVSGQEKGGVPMEARECEDVCKQWREDLMQEARLCTRIRKWLDHQGAKGTGNGAGRPQVDQAEDCRPFLISREGGGESVPALVRGRVWAFVLGVADCAEGEDIATGASGVDAAGDVGTDVATQICKDVPRCHPYDPFVASLLGQSLERPSSIV